MCTLHADGPATLKRLRQADCASLDDVLALDGARLANLIRASASAAERFQREARSLKERIGHELDARVAAPASAPEARKQRAIERVLTLWREKDDRSAPDDERDDESSNGEELTVVEVALEPALEPGAVDGLDDDACEALARAGVRDLRALATCDALGTARSSGLAYTRLVRARALAKRAVEATTSPSVAHAPREEKFSAAEGPLEATVPLMRFENDYILHPPAPDGGAGGPFA